MIIYMYYIQLKAVKLWYKEVRVTAAGNFLY